MCGIAGAVNVALSESVLNLIRHRGPNHQALIERKIGTNQVFLGHTRLSILDLSSSGNQPMFSDCGNFAIVFNGEIYNHIELRNKLSHVHFKGHSDTETILYYIREFGIDRVDDFNGIFAFAFLDLVEKKIYLVRDHFGVKPMYYHLAEGKLIFSSELKILLKAGVKKEINLAALDNLLTLRYNPSPQTLFTGIQKLSAASYLEFDIITHRCENKRYWKSAYQVKNNISEKDAIAEYAVLFENAIKRQLLSDVPVGLFLSGGLDSALVGKIMSQHTNYKIKTFTVGFSGQGNYNELEDASITAEFIGSEHHAEYIDQQQYLHYFRESFYHTEEPIAEPTIPALYHVSKMAAKEVKVVLSGQGADEPMAGYKRYRGEQIISNYSKILQFIPHNLVEPFFKSNESIQRGMYSVRFKDELERLLAIYTIFNPELKKKIYKKEMLEEMNKSVKPFFEKHFNEVKGKSDSLNRMLYLDTRTMLPDNLLLFNDKITMAHSIENRVPFLDKDLVAFVESLPSHYKLKGKVGKYLEKQAAHKWLPKEIIHRKKRGFETPVEAWFRQDLYPELITLFSESGSLSRQYFNLEKIIEMVDCHKQGRRNFSKQLFILYSLELWYRNFYQRM